MAVDAELSAVVTATEPLASAALSRWLGTLSLIANFLPSPLQPMD